MSPVHISESAVAIELSMHYGVSVCRHFMRLRNMTASENVCARVPSRSLGAIFGEKWSRAAAVCRLAEHSNQCYSWRMHQCMFSSSRVSRCDTGSVHISHHLDDWHRTISFDSNRNANITSGIAFFEGELWHHEKPARTIFRSKNKNSAMTRCLKVIYLLEQQCRKSNAKKQKNRRRNYILHYAFQFN